MSKGKAETYTYDEIGNLLEKTDRNGNGVWHPLSNCEMCLTLLIQPKGPPAP